MDYQPGSYKKIDISEIGNRHLEAFTLGGVFSNPHKAVIDLVKRENLDVYIIYGQCDVLSTYDGKTSGYRYYSGKHGNMVAIDSNYFKIYTR